MGGIESDREERPVAGLRGGRWIPCYDPAFDPIRAAAIRHAAAYAAVERAAWVAVVALSAVDVLTTLAGLPHPLIAERMAASRWALSFGPLGLAAKQAAVLALLGAFWLALPRPYRLAVLGSAVGAGCVLAVNNLSLLVAHGVIPVP